MIRKNRAALLLGFGALILASPGAASVKSGVEAWRRGDYNTAVNDWQAEASHGDADAMYNLAQAYRLGRGVPADMAKAETLYAQAAAKGHLRAADNYGLILFQDPARRAQAIPFIQSAAQRGDPRAYYLLGIALFNGDGVESDWERAYALLTLANGQGLPQAPAALAEMDKHVPLETRQKAQLLARKIEADVASEKARELGGFSLPVGNDDPMTGSSAAPTSQIIADTVPSRLGNDPVNPGLAVRQNATPQPVPVPASKPAASSTLAAKTAPTSVSASAPAPRKPAASGGKWMVQLGAFSVAANADKMWSSVSKHAELAGATKLTIPSGKVTRLLAGGFATQAEAGKACSALKKAGNDCLVTSR